MDAIADEAKVAKGTICLYFPSKQAIYEATFLEGMVELNRLADVSGPAAGLDPRGHPGVRRRAGHVFPGPPRRLPDLRPRGQRPVDRSDPGKALPRAMLAQTEGSRRVRARDRCG